MSIKNKTRSTLLTLCFFILGGLLALPLQSFTQENKERIRIELIYADHALGKKKLHPDANIFKGNVHFRHKGMDIFCDSVLLFSNTNSIEAFSNIKMQQGDTLFIYGDYLYYDGVEELARLRDNIRMINGPVLLVTDSLNYDRVGNFGYYFDGGELTDPQNRLVSDWGQYNVDTKIANFHQDVILINDNSVLTSDTLNYNTESKIVSILGPSKIVSGGNEIHSTKGFYNTITQETDLYNRSKIDADGRIMTGDSLFYNHLLGFGYGYGNVQMVDTIRRNMIEGNYCYYNEKDGTALAYDRTMLVDFSQGDSLYIYGDTLRLNTFNMDTDSVYRVMRLYNKVRMFRNDLQGVSDSLVYNSKDSCITLYNEPVIWNENQQLLGEKIMMYLNDSTIDWVHIENQALGVEQLDSIHYNQIAGKEIKGYFEGGQMHQVDVDGNVMINFYQVERNNVILGVIYAETSHMEIEIENMELQKVNMTPATTGVFYPLFLIPDDKLYLNNFVWLDYLRPLNKEDIFNWRSKKPEHMLKSSTAKDEEGDTLIKQIKRRNR